MILAARKIEVIYVQNRIVLADLAGGVLNSIVASTGQVEDRALKKLKIDMKTFAQFFKELSDLG